MIIHLVFSEEPTRLVKIYNGVDKEEFTLALDIEVNDQFKEYVNESYSEVHNKYYNGSKYPLFINNESYHLLPDNTYIFKSRVGRDKMLNILRLDKDEYCNIDQSNEEVELFNIKGDKIAEFKNKHYASLITGVSINTIHRDLNYCKNKKLKPLTFKYKNNKNKLIKN